MSNKNQSRTGRVLNMRVSPEWLAARRENMEILGYDNLSLYIRDMVDRGEEASDGEAKKDYK